MEEYGTVRISFCPQWLSPHQTSIFFVNDFVTLSLPNLGVTIAKVLKFFQKVSCSIINIRVYIFAAPLGGLLVCIC